MNMQMLTFVNTNLNKLKASYNAYRIDKLCAIFFFNFTFIKRIKENYYGKS